MTSVAGAYTAIAEDVEGVASNAASPAVREPHSFRWLEFDVSAGVSLPGAYGGTDFNNRGEKGDEGLIDRTSRFLHADLGARVQAGSFGAVAAAELLQYDVVQSQGDKPGLKLNYLRSHATAAYGFWRNQLVMGAGFRIVTLQLSESSTANPSNAIPSTGALLTMTGAGPELGAVLKPDDVPWRLGATVRAPVSAEPIGRKDQSSFDGVQRAGSYITPQRIVQPWEIELGAALQLGPRPLSPRWIDPREQIADAKKKVAAARAAWAAARVRSPGERPEDARAMEAAIRAGEDAQIAEEEERLYRARKARYENWPRERLLLLASLLVSGPSADAIALEGFLDQKREVVGSSVSLAPRAGVEAEPMRDRIRARVGGYIEPSRFADGTRRQHFTFGGDIKLFQWSIFGLLPDPTWQITVVVDLAPRYQNYGIGISNWH